MSVTYPTSILQLTEDEQHELAKVAALRLHALGMPNVAIALKRQYSGLYFSRSLLIS